jgi:hypothetical protein
VVKVAPPGLSEWKEKTEGSRPIKMIISLKRFDKLRLHLADTT